eukprot:177599-Pyramimonas_sp.AAC.1
MRRGVGLLHETELAHHFLVVLAVGIPPESWSGSSSRSKNGRPSTTARRSGSDLAVAIRCLSSWSCASSTLIPRSA